MDGEKKKSTIWNLADRLQGDKVVWVITLMLILTSIVCIFSSTSRLLEGEQTRLDLVRNQLYIVAAGVVVILVCFAIKNVNVFRWLSRLGFPLSLALLLILDLHLDLGAVKAIRINDAWRIIQVGPIQVHVFEIVKVAMVLYLAWAMDALGRGEIRKPASPKYRKILFLYAPFIITFFMTIPGSNTAALFIGGLMFIVILLGGGNARDMCILALAGLLVIGACCGLYEVTKDSPKPRMERIGTAMERILNDTDYEEIYLDRNNSREVRQDALDRLRQPYGAMIAIKEGGLFGKGPGQSTQRYMVPDMAEDYMYSFIIEEYGLFGGILVLVLYLSLLARGSIIARQCDDLYSKLTVAGLTLLVSGQAYLHMFVNAGIGPMTGQTLPMISHGNSAFLCFCLAFGIILSISRSTTKEIEKMQEGQSLLEAENTLRDLEDFESNGL